MAHEHERDWASFQMEWVYLAEICIMAHAALEHTQRVMRGLIVYPKRMMVNLGLTNGLLLAERVMLELGKKIGRQKAHDAVYAAAMRAVEERVSFADILKQTPLVSEALDDPTIDSLLDPVAYTGLAQVFVDRVLLRPAPPARERP